MEYRNILIIKMSSLGDVLHTLPFVAALRTRFPRARLTWLVHPQFAGFVPDKPLIDEVLFFDKVRFKKLGWQGRLAYFRQMYRELHARKFDLVIDMQGLFKSAVLAAISGCSNRIGYCEMREGSGLISKAIVGPHAKEHVIERYLDVASFLGAQVTEIQFPLPDLTKEWTVVSAKLRAGGLVPAAALAVEQAGAALVPSLPLPGDAATKESVPQPWDATGVVQARVQPVSTKAVPYVVLVPGARWETKAWPAENYRRLAQLLIQAGYGVVLAGGPEDKHLGEAIDLKVPLMVNLIGQTSLRELGALIQQSCFYISGDTGPLFIATACKKPLLALYGPTRPERTGPYGSKVAKVLVTPEPCAGCLKKHCTAWRCMRALTPEFVFAEFCQLQQAVAGQEVK